MSGALIYARQSLAKEGRTESVDRQLQACRRLCHERGYNIVAEHEDRGVSAYDPKATRPGFGALIDDVARGRGEVVVAFHPDRLWRQPLDREAFIGVAAASGLEAIETVQGGRETIGNVDEGFLGDLGAILARRESATIARRMRAKHATKRTVGEWPGGPAPLGYRLDPKRKSLTVEPAEAKLVRLAVKKLLDGESSLTVSRWLSAESGRRWTPEQLPKAAHLPDAGRTARGWLQGPVEARRGPGRPRGAGGLAPVQVKGQARPDRQIPTVRGHALWSLRPRHGCRSTAGQAGLALLAPGRGCGVVSISDDIATEGLLDELATMLDSVAFRESFAAAMEKAPEMAAAAQAIVELRTRLTMLEDALASGDLDLVAFRRLAPKVRADLAQAEQMLRASSGPRTIGALPANGEALRESWSHLSPAEARVLVGLFAEKVTVTPRVIGGPRRQPGRVKIVGRW